MVEHVNHFGDIEFSGQRGVWLRMISVGLLILLAFDSFQLIRLIRKNWGVKGASQVLFEKSASMPQASPPRELGRPGQLPWPLTRRLPSWCTSPSQKSSGYKGHLRQRQSGVIGRHGFRWWLELCCQSRYGLTGDAPRLATSGGCVSRQAIDLGVGARVSGTGSEWPGDTIKGRGWERRRFR